MQSAYIVGRHESAWIRGVFLAPEEGVHALFIAILTEHHHKSTSASFVYHMASRFVPSIFRSEGSTGRQLLSAFG